MSDAQKSLRTQLLAGGTSIGSWISSNSSVMAEIMAGCGFDFLTVDAEHAPTDMERAFQLFQAIRSGNPNCPALARVEGVNYQQIKRYLDAGATGIIAPMVNTTRAARELVDAAKFPPLGNRGLGFCRANGYGEDIEDYFLRANDDTLVVAQIEHVEALCNIDGILSTPGIDAAYIGPFDLSASMGIAGQFDHPDMKDAIDLILKTCRRKHIVPGIHVVQPDPEEVLRRQAEGFRLIAYSLDITMVQSSCRAALKFLDKRFEPIVRQRTPSPPLTLAP